ncbi:ABC transporter ATP-binding protein [Alicyclobacillus vulcanalis]|uniref:Putative ABC transport system ATP-binding protein n=2 Tax=Alicyclobacillus TaxID=29330 RepID=A0A1N7KBL2_9BACL|nr:ABC transporter ATP-binding protein [Alicyclobacillus vulcanalis]SIS58929.1 putative ABC transport system ATP-binding protein [Alicyclobacillus vulcanalis]
MIRLVGVTKSYTVGDQVVRVLKGIDLEVHKGEFVALMGPSGSGKSTLMHILGLLDQPDAGTYELNGQSVSVLTARELARLRNESIGFVFQNFHLIPRMSALRNVELPMVYRGVPRAKRRARAMELLERVGMKDRMHHLPNALSGGQRQRVAIARALANDPPLLLADEPTGALDQQTGAEILGILQDLNAAGRTIVVITHDPHVARAGQRILYMVDGEIVREEARDEHR